METGIYGPDVISLETYLADPCPSPSFTNSMARLISRQSPRHAWEQHPRLNPEHRPEHKRAFDLGSAVHSLFLEGDDTCIQVIDAQDYRTKAAQAERDRAYANGLIPLLAHQLALVLQVAAIAARTIVKSERLEPYMDGAKPEQTVLWTEPGGLWCRGRLDLLSEDGSMILNYKTTETSAEPGSYGAGLLIREGFHIQAYHHCRGIEVLTGNKPHYYWMVQELKPPYACSFLDMAPSLEALAEAEWAFALSKWHECISTNEWPSYPTDVASIEAPTWRVTQFCERDELGGTYRPGDILDVMAKTGGFVK